MAASSWANAADPEELATTLVNGVFKERRLDPPDALGFTAAMGLAQIHQAVAENNFIVDDNLRSKCEKISRVGASIARQLTTGYREQQELNRIKGTLWKSVTDAIAAVLNPLPVSASAPSPSSASAPTATPAVAAEPAGATGVKALPDGVLSVVLTDLDARAQAAAAASCSQLRAAVAGVQADAPWPPAFGAYLQMLQRVLATDDTDGSSESAFVGICPLDGSPAVGADMARAVSTRRALAMSTDTFFAALVPPGRIQELRASLPVPKPPPHARTSPLASFKPSAALPFRGGGPELQAGPTPASGPSTSTPSSSPAATTPLYRLVRDARCDVDIISQLPAGGHKLVVGGDIAVMAYTHGWKQRDPGLSAVALVGPKGEPKGGGDCRGFGGGTDYDLGFYDVFVEALCADPDNALVWAAGDEGSRIKAFRAPRVAPTRPEAAACNRGRGWAQPGQRKAGAGSGKARKAAAKKAPQEEEEEEDDDDDEEEEEEEERPYDEEEDEDVGAAELCYTLRSLRHPDNGLLLSWDIAHLAPQQRMRSPNRLGESDSEDDDEEDEDDDEDREGSCHEEAIAGRGEDGSGRGGAHHRAPGGENEGGSYKGQLGWRDTEDPQELECTSGYRPHAIRLMQRPEAEPVLARAQAKTSARAQAKVRGTPAGSKPASHTEPGWDPGGTWEVKRTCLLTPPSSTTSPSAASSPSSTSSATLIAALSSAHDHVCPILAYDLETLRIRNRFFGHIYGVSGLSPSPESPHLFASSARSGNVKLWDVRSPGGSAVVTLRGGSTEALNDVVLLGGGGGERGRLGAGAVCFAGGGGESIWCWDVRAGSAQPLYELSTGNLEVLALAWHPRSASLLASCSSPREDRMGGFNRSDWRRVRVARPAPPAAAARAAGAGAEEEEDEEEQEEGYSGSEGDEDDGDEEEEEEEEGGQPRRKRWWPVSALHEPDEFGRYFNRCEGGLLRYRFGTSARRRVPPSDSPYFDSYGDW
ncbi:hypothetical protein HYH03_014583 [Edaphochlamys debaryana]|uniref:Uncharacterized protein n=1 Tax=Edaphochlamys debaryana TaxID=47281 RepID=A0A835XVW8_9CHLO|nr:hypothetical protein HYH03_014583 [Edaphochlamys debaryana]|eukprot:KAG2486784.1 hypothetical protein HYH03_014583 [Edaphochlamys debaryana]